GLILAAVFSAARWYWVLAILVVMAAIATHAAVSRLAKPIPGVYWIAAAALTISTAATITYVIGIVVQPRPWWEPQYLIPIAGMMTGQILAGASPLTAIRYQIVVVFMLAVATTLGSLLFVRLAVARYLTPAHQLRRYLL